MGGLDAGFFEEFATGGLFRRFAMLYFAAGDAPKACFALVMAALKKEEGFVNLYVAGSKF